MPTTTVALGAYDPATATYGPDPGYTQPPGSTSVAVGNLNQALLDGASAGTVFWLQAGTHRPAAEIATMLVPKANMEFHGAPGAILSGSVIIPTGSWTSDGAGHWFATGQTQRGVDGLELFGGNPVSPADFPRAWKSETVYIDNVIQKHQNALADVGPGEWFFDYAQNRIYIGTDPAGKVVETTIADQAIVGGGGGVVLRNLTVEKFMSALQVAAVDCSPQPNWQVIDCEVRWNHGIGLKVSDGGSVVGSRIKENGQMGCAGGGPIRWEACEIAGNNTMGIASGWEAGGTKFVFSTDLVLRRNWAHHNAGPGLWADIMNQRTQFLGNLCEHNARMGIFHEINPTSAVIRGNICRYNGTDVPGQGANYNPEGAGIVVTDSNNVEISHNVVLDNSGGGIVGIRDGRAGGVDGYDLRGLSVHDNTITMHTGLPGVGTGNPCNGVMGDAVAFTAAYNNRFTDNDYIAGSLATTFWQWDGAKTWAQWQAVPQDANGSANVG
jgi:Right handed beta helix region